MSLLYRNGTGRNNIAWGEGTTTSGNYLRRTGTSRNSISFIQISTNGTWNILNRTSSGRNNIQWKNTTFSFKKATIEGLFEPFLNAGVNGCYVYPVSYTERMRKSIGNWYNNGSYIYFTQDYQNDDTYLSPSLTKIIARYHNSDAEQWRNNYSYLAGDTSFTIRTLVNTDNTGDGIFENADITSEIELYISSIKLESGGNRPCVIEFKAVSYLNSFAIFQGSRFYLN